ncbi:MAG: hypothetical protein ACE5GS_06745 [Kiloniellaceae bacterium]
MVTCYPSAGKRKARKLCHAFAAGCAGRVAAVGEPRLHPGPAFFYGMTGHGLPLIEQCRREERDWYYADNAYYFGRGTHFRVTRNALMHDGSGRAGPARFERFGLEIKPWRRDGRHVVLATQSELFYRLHLGVERRVWTDVACSDIRRHTDRTIIVCDKPPPPWPGGHPHPNFETALRDAWAVVSHSSSVMVKALLEGVPVFSLGPSMASRMASADVSSIEEPLYPNEREPWLWNLAANQWTRAEMRDGTCWRDLRRQREADAS